MNAPTKRLSRERNQGGAKLSVPGDPLATRALHIVTTNLSKFGNELSSDHIGELRTLLRGMSELARGKRSGRYAYALDCGLGKTQAVIALCTAIHQLGKAHLSVAISASQVEALCQVKRDLINNGVPEEEIGLIHSYKFNPEKIDPITGAVEDGYASLPATANNDQRRFQLVTHNRVKGGRANLDQYARYKGKRRSLLVYDESLFISEPSVLDSMQLEQSWGWIRPKLQWRMGSDPTTHRAHDYLAVAIEAIKAELHRQARTRTRAAPIELEQLPIEDIVAFKQALGNGKTVDPLKRLLEMSQERLRAVHTGHMHGTGLVTYDVTVPPELENIAVLDASFPIRLLEKRDASIQPGTPERPNGAPPVKSYEQVTIHHLKTASGRGSLTDDFTNKDGSKFLLEIVHLIKDVIPADEGIIVFTFKPKPSWDGRGQWRGPVDFAQRIRDTLRDAGGDADATVVDRNGNTHPRLVIVTWGNETSTSHYSYCRNVVFAGVMHRNHLDLASYLIGQKDDLWAHVNQQELAEAMQTEAAHCVYQGGLRSGARIVEMVDGQAVARRTNIWLPYPNETLKPWLDIVMPRVRWQKWAGKYITERETKQSAIGALIKGALAGVPQDQTRVSIRALWGLRPEFAGFQPQTRMRALADLLEDGFGAFQWVKEGRSLIRDNMFPSVEEETQQQPVAT